MLQLTERDWQPVAKSMELLFWELFIAPVYELATAPLELFNSRKALLEAIREGKITYYDGEFTGDFNSRTSRELSKFADFDGRSKTWKGQPPPEVLGAAVVANERARKLTNRLRDAIAGIEAQVESAIRTLSFPIGDTLERMNRRLVGETQSIAIVPKITEAMQARLVEDYTKNQYLNIKNWSPKQVERLREMVERFVLRGHRRDELRDLIAHEWGVSQNKAQFLARQETSLFMSKLRRERYLEAGVRRYRWSTSSDERVREDHKELHGGEYFFGDPPIVDKRTGRRAEPGEDYNCRCVAIPIITRIDRM